MFKVLDVPTTSITELKKAPMAIIDLAKESNTGVYVLNRNEVAGVVLSEHQYKAINKENDQLHEEILLLETALRLSKTDIVTFTDKEVRASYDVEIDENDGWD